MPGFVRSKKDEARWKKAKQSASDSKKKGEEHFSDRDWALTNYIYHKLQKSIEDVSVETSIHEIDGLINELKEIDNLIKARPSDEDEDTGPIMDTKQKRKRDDWGWDEPTDQDEDEYSNLDESPSQDEDDYSNLDESPYEDEDLKGESGNYRLKTSDMPESERESALEDARRHKKEAFSIFQEPELEEILKIRDAARAHSISSKKSDLIHSNPAVNPLKTAEGFRLGFNHEQYKGIQEATDALKQSEEFRKANSKQKTLMLNELKNKWAAANNPDRTSQITNAHAVRQAMAEKAKQLHQQTKAQNLRDMFEQGGAGAVSETFSPETAAQHVGHIGDEGERGGAPSTSDPIRQFANQNREFVESQKDFYRKYYEGIKNPDEYDFADLENYQNAIKNKAKEIAGSKVDSPALNAFIKKYQDLARVAGKSTLAYLGLRPQDIIHEEHILTPGTIGLQHAIATYDPTKSKSKKGFIRWAIKQMQGAQLSALSQIYGDQGLSPQLRAHAKRLNIPGSKEKPKAETARSSFIDKLIGERPAIESKQEPPKTSEPATAPEPVKSPEQPTSKEVISSMNPHKNVAAIQDRFSRIPAPDKPKIEEKDGKKVIIRKVGPRESKKS